MTDDALLPQAATRLEVALSLTDARILATPVPMPDHKRPAVAPEHLLPYLAWERSVDVWDARWPVATRRAVIEAAYETHRRGGLRAAIVAALGALGVEADIVEWHETSPQGPAYTFRVTAHVRARIYPDGPWLSDEIMAAIRRTILRVKPVSRDFELRVAAGLRRPLGLAAVATARARVREAARLAPATALAAPLGIAAHLTARARLRVAALVTMEAS
jgi:phage tail P2-like protein